jgi:hypothetical protein
MDDHPRPEVRISDAGQIAAALPHLIGFHPHESVVVVGLGGPSGGRVGMAVRADLPAPARSAEVARVLAASIATDDPAAVVVAVVSESPDDREPLLGQPEGEFVSGLPHRDVVHDVVVALAALDTPVRETVLVRRGRWWSYDCPEPCCAPDGGVPLPEVGELAAAAVAGGVVVERDRAALGARIARLDGAALAAMEATTWRVGERRAEALLADPDAEARRAWDTVLRALRRCRPVEGAAAGPLTDREVARVLWAVADVAVRDRALGLALGDDAAAAEVLWTECTRRGPAPFDAAPATLLAVSAWLRGDGAMANVALERALDSRPGYSLARLLAQGLTGCLPPAALRAMVREAVGLEDAEAPG